MKAKLDAKDGKFAVTPIPNDNSLAGTKGVFAEVSEKLECFVRDVGMHGLLRVVLWEICGDENDKDNAA